MLTKTFSIVIAAAICLFSSYSAGGDKIAVAPVRLADEPMTPFELVLTKDIPAGTELRLRQEGRLRPVIVGIYQITRVTVSGMEAPLQLRDAPTFQDISSQWGKYEQGGQMAILKAAKPLPIGTKLTVYGVKYKGVRLLDQRYTWREVRVWLEPLGAASGPASAVSQPLIVRTVSGPVEYLKAYRKADGRLEIQAFDKLDNAADDTGATYTVTAEGAQSVVVPATPGPDLTEVMLPADLKGKAIEVADQAGHRCRSSALPRGLDGQPIFFGDIHFHTSFSDGDYPTGDAIAWARSRMGLDFTGPGDHISGQGEFDGRTAADYVKIGRQFEQPGKFCRIPAFELAGPTGHQLLLARDFETFVATMDRYVKHVGAREDKLDAAGFCNALTEIMAPGKTMIEPAHPIGTPGRWPNIPDKSAFAAADMIRGPQAQESYKADRDWLAGRLQGGDESSLQYALSIGYRLGFMGCSDNHRPLPGQPQAVYHGTTAVQADKLDTASVFDAILHRRCYATSGARIVADATLNGQPIGSQLAIKADQPRAFHIVAHGTAPIVETQIIHCGTVLKAFPADGKAYDVEIRWTDTPPAGRKTPSPEYYYIRLRQSDGHVAWLSPFYIKTP